MKKIIISLIMAAILFCLPVSAVEEPVYLPNYGGTRAMRGNYNFYVVPIGTTVKFADDLTIYTPGTYFQAQFNLDYTYHIRFWFEITPYTNIDDIFSIPNRFGFLNGDINLTGLNTVSTYSNSDGNDYLNYIAYDQNISGNTVTYDLYFNTSPGNIDNIPAELAYYYCGLDFNNKVDGGYSVKYTHIQVEAWSDREAEIYEEILDQIAANQEVIIDNQEAMINVGSDYIPSISNNDTQLESAVGSIDSAEDAILSATDPTGTAMSDFSSQAKLTMSDINTSYNASFAYINGLVDRVFDLGMGTVVFLSLTMGLVAYIFGRIR